MNLNKIIKKIGLIFFSIFFINISYAKDTNVCIHYLDINRKIQFFNVDKDKLENDLKIMTESKNIEKQEINNCLLINIKGKPDIYLKDFKIEVHAGTIFINGRGIGLSNKISIIKDLIIDGVLF